MLVLRGLVFLASLVAPCLPSNTYSPLPSYGWPQGLEGILNAGPDSPIPLVGFHIPSKTEGMVKFAKARALLGPPR